MLGAQGPRTHPAGLEAFRRGRFRAELGIREGLAAGTGRRAWRGPGPPVLGPGAERVGQRALRSAAEQAEESHGTPPRATVRGAARRRAGVLGPALSGGAF